MQGKTIVVWFSCGAASAVAAKKTIELYGKDNTIRVVNNPIKEEHWDNRRFLKDVEKWLDITVEYAVNPKYKDQSCVEVWDKGFSDIISTRGTVPSDVPEGPDGLLTNMRLRGVQ